MNTQVPTSTMIEGLFFLGLLAFVIYILVWYVRECEQIDRDFEPIDRRLAELKAKHDA